MPKGIGYQQQGGQKRYSGGGKDPRCIGNRGGVASSTKDGLETVVPAKTASTKGVVRPVKVSKAPKA